MPHEALHYAEEWLRIAEKDFTRVERLLSLDDPEAAVSDRYFLTKSERLSMDYRLWTMD